MAPNDVIIDDPIIDESAQATDAEMARALQIIQGSMYRRQAHANEVALKGLYVDWAFDKLNLTKYR